MAIETRLYKFANCGHALQEVLQAALQAALHPSQLLGTATWALITVCLGLLNIRKTQATTIAKEVT